MSTSLPSDELTHRYIIGIDLGTTNSAVAYVDLADEASAASHRSIRFFEVPQLVASAEVADRSILPSFLYLPGEYDLPPGSTRLPWDDDRPFMVGEFAREQGAKVPGRLVASAKSWLCHAGVDRQAPILPWGAPEEISGVSPVTASMRYLEHVREAWNQKMAATSEDHNFEEQFIVLTVPASFDEVARELTISAANQAGIPRVVLLEEPLAAFYAWLSNHEKDWQSIMADGQVVLVCDVGGGTTDFSIIGVREGEKGLRFNRLAVGDHLMLGGDNMDLALGRHLEARSMGQPGKLENRQWHQLVYQCRKAKEKLLGAPNLLEKMDISVMGTAGKLIAGTIKGSLSQQEIQDLILDGFFPEVNLDDDSGITRRSGLTEMGLPYVNDPAITRHLAMFWSKFRKLLKTESGREDVFPDYVLFNGGVLTPDSIRKRLQGVIGGWFRAETSSDWIPEELQNPRPELAVAIGAAYYGMVRQGAGVRVGSGSPRSYYISVAGEGDNQHPGAQQAVCLVARGTEEGFETDLSEPAFEALANQPVSFQLISSSTRLGDQLSDVVTLETEEITLLPPMRTVLRYGKKEAARQIPVQLQVRLTEIGTLELWCKSRQSDHRWQLQFDVRHETETSDAPLFESETVDQSLVEAACEELQRTFQSDVSSDAHAPEQLVRRLEAMLDISRKDWPTALIRQMADTLLTLTRGKTLTPQHEARWFNLLGYCLRPGFGDPLDDWRMKQVWKLFFDGLSFPNQARSRAEWWIFWRRVSGGLTAGKQLQIFEQVWPLLQNTKGNKKKGSGAFAKYFSPQEALETWMMAASFERLKPENKTLLGNVLIDTIKKRAPRKQELWALSRLGARQTVYGPLDRVITSDAASRWLQSLLKMPLENNASGAYALIQLSRKTGDRKRDIAEEHRLAARDWLKNLGDPQRFLAMLDNPDQKMGREEQGWLLGETLPSGLVLSTTNKDA